MLVSPAASNSHLHRNSPFLTLNSWTKPWTPSLGHDESTDSLASILDLIVVRFQILKVLGSGLVSTLLLSYVFGACRAHYTK